jgi:hypothetical protein
MGTSFGGVSELPSPRNTQKRDKTKKKRENLILDSFAFRRFFVKSFMELL